MEHTEFIQKLRELGFDMQVFAFESTGFDLYVNSLKVDNKDYNVFGYYCGGHYAPCARTDKNEFTDNDLMEAVKTCSSTIMSHYESLYNSVDYHDCRNFLNKYGKSKIDKESIKRVLNILKDNFQEIWRTKEKFSTELKKY